MQRDEHRLLVELDTRALQWDTIIHAFQLSLPTAGREVLALDSSPWHRAGQALPPYHHGFAGCMGEASDALDAIREHIRHTEVEHSSSLPLTLSGCTERTRGRETQGA